MQPNDSSTRKITRREFFRISGVSLAGAMVAGQLNASKVTGAAQLAHDPMACFESVQ